MARTQSHQTNTSVVQIGPTEVAAGADLEFNINVVCPVACDLRGQVVHIIAHDAVTKEAKLTEFDGAVNETDKLTVKSPIKPGEYTWRAVFPMQEKEGILHQASSTSFSFVVRPHIVSLTVSEAPSTVVLGGPFNIKVEVRCSADCDLAGQEVEVYDHEGTKVATATLRNAPSPDVTARPYAQIELQAPKIERRFRWTVKFPAANLEIPHEEASCTFAFGTARRPEHWVTLQVIDRDTKTPVEDAIVLLYPHLYRGSAYRSRTDAAGAARLGVPGGKYELYVSAGRKDALEPTVEVASDLTILVEIYVREREWWEP